MGNTERHAKLRIAMSADRSVRKDSSQALKTMTNQESQVETIERHVKMGQYQWPLYSGGSDCHNVVDFEVAFDSHAYAD